MNTAARLKHVAEINPRSSRFEDLDDGAELSFVPLECVWPRNFDASRRRTKASVASGYTRFETGDILVPKITPTFQADRTVIADSLLGGVGAGTTELHVVRPTEADATFVRYLLSSHHFLNGGEAEMIGVAGQKRVPEDWLRTQQLHISDVGKQRRIAAFLDAETERIDQLIATKTRMIEVLDARLRAWARQATSEGASVRLGRLLKEVQTGSTPSGGAASDSEGVEWVTPGDLGADFVVQQTARRVSSEAAQELPVFPSSTVLLVGIGATAGRVGFLDRPMTGNQQMTCLVPDRSRLNWQFLGWWLWSRQDQIRELAPYTTLPILNNDYVRSIEMLAPSVRWQQEMVDALNRELEKAGLLTAGLNTQIDLLQERRRSLITAAVTGEMEVP